MDTRRVRHGEALGDNLIAVYINDNTAIMTPVAPAIDNVRSADGTGIARRAIFHRQAIQVTAIFGRQLTDKVWLPNRFETVLEAKLAKAGIFGVDKDDATIFADPDFVQVDRACGLKIPGHIDFVMFAIGDLSGADNVFEPDDLIVRGELEPCAIADHPHGLRIMRLVKR